MEIQLYNNTQGVESTHKIAVSEHEYNRIMEFLGNHNTIVPYPPLIVCGYDDDGSLKYRFFVAISKEHAMSEINEILYQIKIRNETTFTD